MKQKTKPIYFQESVKIVVLNVIMKNNFFFIIDTNKLVISLSFTKWLNAWK